MERPLLRLILAFLILGTVSTWAQSPAAQRGHRFVQENCAQCHAVELFGDSPLAVAPRFRDLHKLYPVEDLAESLAEGIATAHADMPQFVLDPDQIGDVIAYLKSLE